MAWAFDGLFEGESPNGLHWDGDGFDNFAELIERVGHALTGGGDAASFVVADVVDDVVAAEIFEEFCSCDHVGAAEVVAHDFDSVVYSGLDDTLDCFFMRARHDDDVRGSAFGHHLGFEVAAIHCLQVGDDRSVGKGLPEFANAMKSFGEDERSASLKPIDASAHREGGCFKGFVDVSEIERDLNNWPHPWTLFLFNLEIDHGDGFSVLADEGDPAVGAVFVEGGFAVFEVSVVAGGELFEFAEGYGGVFQRPSSETR